MSHTKTNKTIITGLSILMLATGMTGCGSASESGNDTNKGNDNKTDTVAETNASEVLKTQMTSLNDMIDDGTIKNMSFRVKLTNSDTAENLTLDKLLNDSEALSSASEDGRFAYDFDVGLSMGVSGDKFAMSCSLDMTPIFDLVYDGTDVYVDISSLVPYFQDPELGFEVPEQFKISENELNSVLSDNSSLTDLTNSENPISDIDFSGLKDTLDKATESAEFSDSENQITVDLDSETVAELANEVMGIINQMGGDATTELTGDKQFIADDFSKVNTTYSLSYNDESTEQNHVVTMKNDDAALMVEMKFSSEDSEISTDAYTSAKDFEEIFGVSLSDLVLELKDYDTVLTDSSSSDDVYGLENNTGIINYDTDSAGADTNMTDSVDSLAF